MAEYLAFFSQLQTFALEFLKKMLKKCFLDVSQQLSVSVGFINEHNTNVLLLFLTDSGNATDYKDESSSARVQFLLSDLTSKTALSH